MLLLPACGGGGGGGRVTPPALTSISVTPVTATLRLTGGRTQTLYAIGHYSNNSTQDLTSSVTWTTSDSNNVAIASNVVSAGPSCAAPCSATITATYVRTSGNLTGTATITIRPDAFTLAQAGDPLAAQQWHLKNTGQTAYSDVAGTSGYDVNAEPVYQNTTSAANICGTGAGCTGYGVIVAVVDSGLEIAHEDLVGNVIHNGSWNFNNNTTDPTNPKTTGDHGTSVAGIIASLAYNNKGGMGVAPEASLKGFNYLESSQSLSIHIASLGGSASNPNSSDVAIFNQSWGYTTTSPWLEYSNVVNQYASGVATLRGGMGAIYVKAAGNDFGQLGSDYSCGTNYGIYGTRITCNCRAANTLGISCGNTNFENDSTLPYNIVVGAVNASGVRSSYSTTGSALWVSAPGGEYGANHSVFGSYTAGTVVYQPAMITTDQSGCSQGDSQTSGGISTFDNAGAPNTNCNYTNTMNGTSSASPAVAGVVALMLEANPNLNWRDVKHILASTPTLKPAKPAITTTLNAVSYTVEQGWVTNAAGYSYHNWYGFGIVNASEAVAMAKTTCASGCGLGNFTAYPGTGSWTTSGTLTATIPDNTAAGVTNTINIAAGTPTFIESVKIQVTLKHSYWGDLAIELTSPSGTKSILKNIRDGFTYNTSTTAGSMELATNAFYGETGNGNWIVRVVDGNDGTVVPSTNNTGGTLTGWGIRIYGH